MRPKSPLLARLANLLSVTEGHLRSTLDGWPTSTAQFEPCIDGPQLVKYEGRAHTTVRVLFEIIFDQPLHKTWKLKRLCGRRECVNPLHFRVEHIFRSDGTKLEPLPARCYRLAILGEEPTSIDDVIDTILSIDDGRTMSPDEHVGYWNGLYNADEFAIALERIRAEGL